MQADEDAKRMRAALLVNPEFAALKAWAHDQRDAYLTNLAKTLFSNPDVVTEAALREKAAFFRGMNIVLNQPFFASKTLEVAADGKEPNEPA